jgi:hypothetical protein
MLNAEQLFHFEGWIDVLVGIIHMVCQRVRCRALPVTEVTSEELRG